MTVIHAPERDLILPYDKMNRYYFKTVISKENTHEQNEFLIHEYRKPKDVTDREAMKTWAMSLVSKRAKGALLRTWMEAHNSSLDAGA